MVWYNLIRKINYSLVKGEWQWLKKVNIQQQLIKQP